MTDFCVYHSCDFDGKCCAAIVKDILPECELIPFDYGDNFPWEKMDDCENLVMLDISLPIEDMIRLSKEVYGFVWIDHHITKIKEYNDIKSFHPIKGLRDISRSACENAWKFFHPLKPIPLCVNMLGKYDIWKHEGIDGCLEFQYGLRGYGTEPDNPVWKSILSEDKEINENFFKNVAKEGENILSYQKLMDKQYARSYSFETEFEGHHAIVLNKGGCGSAGFEGVWDRNKYDLMISFILHQKGDKMEYIVSMYTDKEGIDAGSIAKKYGGGGHTQACGFQCEKLPFIK